MRSRASEIQSTDLKGETVETVLLEMVRRQCAASRTLAAALDHLAAMTEECVDAMQAARRREALHEFVHRQPGAGPGAPHLQERPPAPGPAPMPDGSDGTDPTDRSDRSDRSDPLHPKEAPDAHHAG